jgi:mono/diheme cytochrome c family protein
MLVVGKALYRQYCGKCHALSVALAAGFGSKANPLGGPSFNSLRVPYSYSIQAVSEPTGGHERLKLTPKQLITVAKYIAAVTAHHPIPASPTDG